MAIHSLLQKLRRPRIYRYEDHVNVPSTGVTERTKHVKRDTRKSIPWCLGIYTHVVEQIVTNITIDRQRLAKHVLERYAVNKNGRALLDNGFGKRAFL
jgi:hypothetical protein